MKKLLLICTIFFFSILANCQTFTLTPGNVDSVDAPFNVITIFDIYQNNITSSKLLFKWTKVSMSLPLGWDYSLCDYATCYTGIPASGTMDSVDAAQMGFLGVNINPYAITGQGIVKIYVYDAAFPTGGDTLTWVINASNVSVADVSSEWDNIEVFPNPTSNYLTISNLPENCNIFIFDGSGKLIETKHLASTTKTVDLSNYANGIYSLIIVNENKIVTRKKISVQK